MFKKKKKFKRKLINPHVNSKINRSSHFIIKTKVYSPVFVCWRPRFCCGCLPTINHPLNATNFFDINYLLNSWYQNKRIQRFQSVIRIGRYTFDSCFLNFKPLDNHRPNRKILNNSCCYLREKKTFISITAPPAIHSLVRSVVYPSLNWYFTFW